MTAAEQEIPKQEKYNTIYLTEQMKNDRRRSQGMLLGAVALAGIAIVLLLTMGSSEPAESAATDIETAVNADPAAEATDKPSPAP